MKEASTKHAILAFLTLAIKADKKRLVKLVVVELAWRASTIVSAYGLKLMVDAVIGRNVVGIMTGAVVVAGPLGIQRVGGPAYVRLVYDLTERILFEVETALARAVSETVGIEHLETPKYLDEVMLAGRQRGMVASMMRILITAVQSGLLLLGSLALLGNIDGRILLLPLFGIPAFLAGRKAASVTEAAAEATAEIQRRKTHIYRVATSAPSGKEVRIFGILPALMESHRRWTDQSIARTQKAGLRASALRASASLFFVVGYVGAIVLVIQKALAGQATPGDVLLALTLAGQINGQVSALAESGETFSRITKTAKRFAGVLDYPRLTDPTPEQPQSVPPALTSGITLDNVSFAYLDAPSPALSGVSFHMKAGSVVALVGENGAGKTTLIKLLARMYEPQEGRILIDGEKLSDLHPLEWRRNISAAFQDFVKFEFTVAESVGIGDVQLMDQEAAVLDALKRAGAAELATIGADGLSTQLGKRWDGGIDLSGGQWQKLALARGMMRTEPLLLVFDEPTAALDAETEHALFERMAAATRKAVHNGMITILISHRFSTVRMADRIVVLENGRVVEQGTHHELMLRRGIYQELYELQAEGYR